MHTSAATAASSLRRLPLAGAGLGIALVAQLLTAEAPHGGLAPLAVVALVAAAIGVPLALVEWRSQEVPHPRVRELLDLLMVLVLASLLAPMVHARAWLAFPVVGAWLALPLLRHRVLPLVALLVLAAPLVAGASLRPWAPWTLLQPGWTTWSQWLPRSLTVGLLLAGAGLGQWEATPREPGTGRLPWALTGGVLLVGLLAAVGAGATWERAPGHLGAGLYASLGLGVLAALLGLARRPSLIGWWSALGGGLLTLWLAGPAWEALPLWWGSLLPLGVALTVGHRAWTTPGPTRLVAGLAALVAGAAALLGWPGLPGPGASAAGAGVAVVAVWALGGRRALRGEP